MSSPATVPKPVAARQIMQMLFGEYVSQAVSVAATLGVADFLQDAPKTAEELATATSTHAPSLYRLLRALASIGVFAEVEGRRFTLTPLGECLRSEAPDSVRNTARFWGLPQMWRPWGELLYCVRTGEPSFNRALGVADSFAYSSQHPEDAEVFDGCMTEISRLNTPALVDAYDFGRFRAIIDVGGSHGTLLSAILRRYPGPRGVVLDVPRVIEGTRRAIADEVLMDRCEAIAGDFFESVPTGADAYLLKQVIHDWNDERALVILRNVRRAISPEGRLVLIEFVIPPANEPSLGKFSDLNMLVMLGGRERTQIEFRDLFAAAGFELTAVHPTAGPQSVIEGVPIGSDRR